MTWINNNNNLLCIFTHFFNTSAIISFEYQKLTIIMQ